MSFLVQVLASAGFAAIVVAIINAVVNKRKVSAEAGQLSADATKIITDAASGVVKEIKDDNERLRQENKRLETREDELEARVDQLERQRKEWRRERDEWRRVLQLHGAWDSLSVRLIRDHVPPIDPSLPDPPPLLPAQTYDWDKIEEEESNGRR